MPSGKVVHWEANSAGDRTYRCDDSGSVLWDTAITSHFEMIILMAKEIELNVLESNLAQEEENKKNG